MTAKPGAPVHIERNLLIPLADGVTLAADLHRPAGEGSFPTLVSYYPYHKDGLIGSMLEYPREYFASHGYASLLVDLRGLGGSSGVAWETLDAREGEDGVQIIEWAAQQDWCDGNIGMWGFSYGGTSTLQTASRRPPNLKAIAPIETLSDVYLELATRFDCLPWFGNWGALMVSMNILPPAYQDPEGRWYEVWMERLENGFPHIFAAKDHPTYDDYWRSRVIPVEQVDVPTFLIGGWRDVNVHAMFRIYDAIQAPRKLVQGPWTHILPYHSPIEPWDYLHELKRWWDRWLKGEENGIDTEPAVTLFVQGSGAWRHEPEWPIKRTESRTLHLDDGGILSGRAPATESSARYAADPTVGSMAGLWDGTGLGIGLPMEQGPDDLRSLTFTTAPLKDDLEITGAPETVLHVELEKGDDLNLVAKLCDLDPDGRSSLITVGSIKGSAYDSAEHPQPVPTGVVHEYRVQLFTTSYLVPRGHRIRLSVSCSDFPRLWPTSTNPVIKLHCGGSNGSALQIPVVPAAPDPLPAPALKRPDPSISDAPLAVDFVPRYTIERDYIGDRETVRMGSAQVSGLPSGGRFSMDIDVSASVARARPDGARIEGSALLRLELPALGQVDVESKTLLYREIMHLEGQVKVNGKRIFEKQWLR